MNYVRAKLNDILPDGLHLLWTYELLLAQSFFLFLVGLSPLGEYWNLQGCVGFLCLSKGSVGLRNDRQTLPKLVYGPQKVKDGVEWRAWMSINIQQVGLLLV